MNPSVSIAVHGASGRMGRAIVRLALQDPATRVVAAIVRPGSSIVGTSLREHFGAAAGELAYTSSLESAPAPQVLIDFSSAHAFDGALAFARSRRIAFLSGTTGLSETHHAALRDAAATIAALWSANFSLGVAELVRLARDAARALSGWDCEISEAHHRHKKDAPSGTALLLGRAVAEARGEDFDRVAQRERAASASPRDPSTIGFAVVRAGDIVGEHTVLFAGDGERIELTHRAADRDIFARGALRAATWLAGRTTGLYTMSDVLEPPRHAS